MTLDFDEATRAQVTAARPESSTWLSANAGSGKTRVLTDRVARLLLQETPPERILCLTYTKAAASEMQNRLFKRLGEWAMQPDDALRRDLLRLGLPAAEVTEALLPRARTLFARAIETPGGLKIQTIHSFCAAVLRRFPLEARVAPDFTEMDERAQALLCEDVLDTMAGGAERDAVDALAAHISGDDAMPLIRALLAKRGALETPLSRDETLALFDLPKGYTAQALIGHVFEGGERDLCHVVGQHLDPGNRNQAANLTRLNQINWDNPGLADIALLEEVFLTGSGTKTPDAAKVGTFPTKPIWAKMAAIHEPLEAFMLRVEAARPLRRALQAAEKTTALHAFSAAFLPAYDTAKAARGWLDFDDLILATRRLLSDSAVAQWVLFRLDGGIDHILVDEAQDTSPPQWDIVTRLAEEFAAGSSARDDLLRTIFVVGDKKQSIYSFQGADPDGFDRMRDHFQARLGEAGSPFQDCELKHSFRSAPPILRVVDKVFEGERQAGLGAPVSHVAFKADLPGRVDVWPAVAPPEKREKPDWHDPVDLLSDDHPAVVLARAVAGQIDQMVRDGTPITVEENGKPLRRAVTPGDILILVQRRSELFHELIAAIKERGLPIAGADRMRLAAELAVKDLTALLSFLATPADDLSLAAVLRSPLCGWSEAALHALAHGRGKATLWQALQGWRDTAPETLALLDDLRGQADFLRPYELLERVLIRHGGRRRLLARMGAEAEDGIDAMLAQAMAYERLDVPSLTGFTGWLQADDVQIKRDPGSAGDRIRVMSVHGAKGLEAPVVILPDTAARQRNHQAPKLLRDADGPLFWAGSKADSPPLMQPLFAEHEAREDEERNRLLYVAMTRAESWLITCAAGKVADRGVTGWHPTIEAAARDCGADSLETPVGPGLRLQTGDWSPVPLAAPPVAAAPLPGWIHDRPKATPRRAPPLSPSDLGGAKALQGDGLSEEAAKRRGRRVHLLLEHLPALPEPGWRAAAPGILAAEGDLPEDEVSALLDEAAACLTAPALAHVFAPDTLAEVTLTAPSPTLGRPLLGTIDRLLVMPDRVLAVDFKSNAVVPGSAADVPEGLLRQMGAYGEMLAALYPDRRVDTALLWTRAASLMPLPGDLLAAALRRAEPESA
ncbi:MAG: double-strand break repair helicase AddA [Nioella sp.]